MNKRSPISWRSQTSEVSHEDSQVIKTPKKTSEVSFARHVAPAFNVSSIRQAVGAIPLLAQGL
jgi:hypothetical protein